MSLTHSSTLELVLELRLYQQLHAQVKRLVAVHELVTAFSCRNAQARPLCLILILPVHRPVALSARGRDHLVSRALEGGSDALEDRQVGRIEVPPLRWRHLLSLGVREDGGLHRGDGGFGGSGM